MMILMILMILLGRPGCSDMLNKLWVEEGESGKLVLVEVHHEELVGGRQLGLLGGELAVKVGDVFPVALQEREGYEVQARSAFTQPAVASALSFFPSGFIDFLRS